MHTEYRIEAPRGVAPEAHDDHVAKPCGAIAREKLRPAHPRAAASDYPPNCVHGMNSFADARYDRALVRLRRG